MWIWIYFGPFVHLVQGELGSPRIKHTWAGPYEPKEESCQNWAQLDKVWLSLV